MSLKKNFQPHTDPEPSTTRMEISATINNVYIKNEQVNML